MDKTSKILTALILVLVVSIGITIGFIFMIGSGNDDGLASTQSNQINTTTQSQQPSWHQIASYSGGVTNEMKAYDFTSKGQKVKVTVSAKPMVTYNTNSLGLYLLKELDGGAYTLAKDGNLTWGSTESPNTKEMSIEDSSGSKTFTLQVSPTDIESWTVTIWDYY